MSPTPNPPPLAPRALVALLAPYLAHNLEIDSPAHGRGTLLGLPWSPAWEQPVAECHFPHDPARPDEEGDCEEYRTGRLRPVLWAPEDLADAIAAAGRGDDLALDGLLGGYLPRELDYFARVTDTLRALGVAVGLTPGQYVRKTASQ